jgi:LmbE family N-acetylglucosaminyl deacetylase
VLPLSIFPPGSSLSVLCLGAHSDDIEIGAGGTILSLISGGVELHVTWSIASAIGEREAEARNSAEAFLAGARSTDLQLGSFQDGYLPYLGGDVKRWVQDLQNVQPDLIFTHRRDDGHQDHRLISELTWNTFRNHLILEYEIPKWDGDIGQPNFYVPLSEEILASKISLLETAFQTQRSRDWFDPETFRGLARLRGVECRAPERYAEAFVIRKAMVGLPTIPTNIPT